MDEEVKERVGTLKAVLGEFIVQTNKSMRKIEEGTIALQREMADFRKEMQRDRQQRDTEMKDFKEEMGQFRDEMRQDRKDMNKRWGDLANRLGTVAEDFAAPNIKTMAQVHFGCQDIDHFSVRVLRRSQRDRKRLTEFDVIIVCRNYLFINETKSNPQKEHIPAFAHKIRDIFDYLPEYEGKTVAPVFSSFSLPESIVEQLTTLKIYAMALGGETMELLNYSEIQQG
ncbi:hypothetical protein [Tunicatimonas pelagia]|uniref:hypothetical protein n=1 Tax=Tunicatimonas pelagia TaxID=931531 RepID=UPI00266530C6|nr:hypothetical protein [Tunicatimonas pelagia]WKN42850.1 hypothetical protein P0M28_27825 [Tunicatimonas pelagia]